MQEAMTGEQQGNTATFVHHNHRHYIYRDSSLRYIYFISDRIYCPIAGRIKKIQRLDAFCIGDRHVLRFSVFPISLIIHSFLDLLFMYLELVG